jgi:alpha-L-rhamnosidase
MNPIFATGARWIWLSAPHHEKNGYVCFRRRFVLNTKDKPSNATLRITADARYEVYVNGVWLGHGPIRSFASPWPVDSYEIRHLLHGGDNVIAVLVHQIGLSTFQYLNDEPGLIAQLDYENGEADHTLLTDGSWRCTPHNGYAWPAPRISVQQGWEEQFDARLSPGAPEVWTAVSFEDSTWQGARELRSAGEPPHEQFEPRDIPFLTRQVLEPTAVQSIEVVRPAPYQFFLNPREFINPIDDSANHIRARMFLATYIYSERAQKVDIHPPHERPTVPWKLNEKLLDFSDRTLQPTGTGVAHAKLKPGWNLLLGKLPQMEHFTWATLNLWTDEPIKFSSTIQDQSAEIENSGWLSIGPFEGAPPHGFDTILIEPVEIDPAATADRYKKIWEAGTLTSEDLTAGYTKPLDHDMVVTNDVYAACASERIVKASTARVVEPRALLTDNDDWTVIDPPGQRKSVRMLLDFGNETIGFHEFEIDAPAGTILDFHNFEFIQRDGRKNLCEGMNNSFRYVCREGIQRYRTFLRRGFRYSWMSVRNHQRPVRVRFVRVLQSTYPIGPAGSFACSDSLLNDIWKAGVHSVRCCAEDTFTDCPTYEQTFWVGDARNEALVHLISDGDARLSEHCLRLTGRSLDRSPITESQVPSGWQNLLPTWTFLWMRWALEHYELTADRPFATEMLTFLERNNEAIRDNLNDMGLFAMKAWNLFDWAPMDTPGTAIVTHINCLAAQGLNESAALAKALGRKDLTKSWTKLADQIADAVNKHLWSKKTNAYLDCIHEDGSPSKVFSQQTATAAYISGVASGPRAKRCLQIIDKPPKGFVTAGSPFFMFFLLEALVREKRFDQLIDTIRDYWGEQIKAGATTFWEMYHPGEERLTRSHCHGWSAAPVVFLTQQVLGVRPAKPGYEEVLVAPKLGNLTFAQGRVPTPRGPIDVYWTTTKHTFEITITASDGTPVRIELPLKGKVNVLEGKLKREASTWITKSPRIKLRVQR